MQSSQYHLIGRYELHLTGNQVMFALFARHKVFPGSHDTGIGLA